MNAYLSLIILCNLVSGTLTVAIALATVIWPTRDHYTRVLLALLSAFVYCGTWIVMLAGGR